MGAGHGTQAGRGAVASGVLRASTLAPGVVPLGLLFGAAAVANGFSPAAAVVASALVFAGGAQFAAVGLAAAGGGAAAAVALVAVVNSRYFLLSAATLDLLRRARAGPFARVAAALGTVDESFALQSAAARERGAEAVPVAALLAIPATLWVLWVGSTLFGALAGNLVPALEPWGLDYALPGIFVGLLGIFADTRERLLAGLGALVAAGALAYAGHGTVAVLVVPPLVAFGLGGRSRGG